MKLLRNEKNRGYIPVFDELLDPVNQVQRDNKEGYDIGVEVPEDDPDAEKPYYGPNIWPQQDQLPRWRETMEKFHQQALKVARSVARIIALALGLDRDFFDKPEMLGEPFATLRLLHYEGQSDPSKGIFGAGAHSDFGLITLLATDDILGLQFIFTSFLWLIFYGAFIVNLGDLLERWSNCIFKSTLHEILANDQDRYSIRLLLICIFCLMQGLQIAYFVYPSHLVECLPTFVKSYLNFNELFVTFPPILCQTYLDQHNKDI
ncbi:hypothetical protein UlMin_005540 [Ulmus minor]